MVSNPPEVIVTTRNTVELRRGAKSIYLEGFTLISVALTYAPTVADAIGCNVVDQNKESR